MESEKLNTIARRLDKEAKQRKKAKEARERRDEQRSERLKARLQPYSELAKRNRHVAYRANRLMNITNHLERQTVVILGETEKSDLTPNHFTVCQLGSSHPFHNFERVTFNYMYIENTQIGRIQRSGSLVLSHGDEPGWHEVVIAGPSEETFRIYPSDFSSDELMNRGDDHVSKKSLEPIRAIGRVFDLMKRGDEVRSLEETMDMVEQAAMDPVLNPFLARELVSQREVEAV